jgi:hypothetical protein
VPVYIGVGGFYLDHGRGWDGDEGHLGVRFPLGIAFEFRAPVQLFFELGARVYLVDIDEDVPHDHDGLDLGGSVGFRIYF